MEGLRNGPHADRLTATADAILLVADGYKLYVDDRLVHHGSVWTRKDYGQRHREHLSNCVRDSQAWNERTVDISLSDCVEQLIQRFGNENMYVRKHNSCPRRSVKVFRDTNGRHCSRCQHCDAYDVLNQLLGCSAAHGPRFDWDGLASRQGEVEDAGLAPVRSGGANSDNLQRSHTGSVMNARSEDSEGVTCVLPGAYVSAAVEVDSWEDRVEEAGILDGSSSGAPTHSATVQEDPADSTARWAKAARPGKCSVLVLRLSHNNESIRHALLQSRLAAEMHDRGIIVEPPWANGAKVFLPICRSALPVDLVQSLRPYHVLVRPNDQAEVEAALARVPCRQRARGIRSVEEERMRFIVERTFVCVPEPEVLTPRSAVTKSTNDGRQSHKNPRELHWQGWSAYPDVSSAGPHEGGSRTLEEHIAEMKDCQRRRDLPATIQCYSNILRDGLEPDQQVFAILIDTCGKKGSMSDMERWFNRLSEHFVPTMIEYNCIMDACARRREPAAAEEWFQRAKEAHLRPSTVSFNCLIKAHAACGDVTRAEAWLDEAQRSVGLNKFSFMPILSCFARQGLLADAQLWLSRMLVVGLAPDAPTLGKLIAAAATARDMRAAEWYCEQLVAAGFPLRVFEYTQLLVACAPHSELSLGRERCAHADAIFREQIRAGIKPDGFNIRALDRALGEDASRSLCEELRVDVEGVLREHSAMRSELGINSWMNDKVGEDWCFARNSFSSDDYPDSVGA